MSDALNPKVTWLLAVKDGMPYLPETLASIEAQTYTNWEMLAWDNGSTDGTLEVLHEWIPSRLPGKVVSDKPLGLGAALAAMVEMADTELCARIDADDVNLPERLEKQVAFLEQHPEVAAVGTQAIEIDAEGNRKGLFVERPTQHDDIVHWMLYRNPMIHPAMMFRRTAILGTGNYRDLKPGQDYDLWLRLAKHAKLANLSESLLEYRIHDKSITLTSKAENLLYSSSLALFMEHAPQLFGCSSAEAWQLRKHKHPFALKLYFKIARHMEKTQGGSRLRSDSFLHAMHRLVRSEDYLTQLYLLKQKQGLLTAAREGRAIVKKILLKLFGYVRKKTSRRQPASKAEV